MRPIFLTNGTLRLEQINDKRPFELSGSKLRVSRGETTQILCPVIGYPIPIIKWYKDSQLITEGLFFKVF